MVPVLRSLTIAVGLSWLLLFLFRGGYSQLAHLSLFVAFFLIGVWIEVSQWRPSRSLALGSGLVFLGITLALALYPQTHRGVWLVGRETRTTPETFLSHLVGLWWVVGAVLVAPFVAWNVLQVSPGYDRLMGNLAYPLYLFHWIPRDWYYHFSAQGDAIWKQGALSAANFVVASGGAFLILWLIDQPLDRLRAAWVDSRKVKVRPPRQESVKSSI
jgi:peptidoglycan/LPS O-acetylase OafA/YrhL